MNRTAVVCTLGWSLCLAAPARAAEADPALAAAWGALDAPIHACLPSDSDEQPGSVTLMLTVASDGHVPTVSMTDAEGGDQDAYVCMMDAARSARFPPTAAKETRLTHTWRFQKAGPTTTLSLRDVLAQGLVAAGRCYDDALADHPGMEGGLVLNLHIGADGSGASAEVASTTLPSESLSDCVENAFGSLVFPASDSDQMLYIPLSFPIR